MRFAVARLILGVYQQGSFVAARRWRLSVGLLVAFSIGILAWADDSTKAAPRQSLDRLRWLTGNWISDIDGTVVEEQWMAPRGGLMLGINRTVKPRGKTQFEFLRIEEKEGQLTLQASPQGQPATPFRATKLTENRVTFENRNNDFPHKVEYWREQERLRARIEGPINGKLVSMEWTWNAAPVSGN